MYRNIWMLVLSLIILCSAAMLLRKIGVELGLLNLSQLDLLAQRVQCGQITVEEAVTTLVEVFLYDDPF